MAPAGNYKAFVGALNAGADAVYLGGDKFSARAYADNFSAEEILKALRYAHFNGRKIYLTLNTLVKDKEFSLIYDYVSPFYEAGLDGIIVQDFGVWEYLRENFPDLPLHASTQMTITGVSGASLLKEAGAARIVPARELSLAEIKDIKDETGLEIECFIHGAMCYSYSGQCLFSSILGGRSGNRGRCAQPCRLPYIVSAPDKDSSYGELYPLSLKDMCTIEYIPTLIEAGIDSFKIEGRMKKPEYAAGVTAFYRKYIDLCYERGKEGYHVDKNDMDKLSGLYIRSDVQTGYYERYNGKEMVTLGKGSYLSSDEALLNEIDDKYLKAEKKCPITVNGTFNSGSNAVLEISGMGVSQTFSGEIVQTALKRPMSREDIIKQLDKTGNSCVYMEAVNIETDGKAFIPVACLNELRRSAITAFENMVIEKNGLVVERKMMPNLQNCQEIITPVSKKLPKLHVYVQNIAQLQAVCQYQCDRIYIDSDLYLREFDQISQHLEKHTYSAIFLALPFILRKKDDDYLEEISALLDDKIQGFLVRSMEAVPWILSLNTEYSIVTDSGVYCFNTAALRFLSRYAQECYLPWELNKKECRHILEAYPDGARLSMPVYGTIPMMLTANCLKKTTDSCLRDNLSKPMYLTDRYKTKFPVLCNCKHCYNIIYNSLPYSLHREWKEIEQLRLYAVRLDFVFESGEKTAQIMDYYTGRSSVFPETAYTTGHYKRGVE